MLVEIESVERVKFLDGRFVVVRGNCKKVDGTYILRGYVFDS